MPTNLGQAEFSLTKQKKMKPQNPIQSKSKKKNVFFDFFDFGPHAKPKTLVLCPDSLWTALENGGLKSRKMN